MLNRIPFNGSYESMNLIIKVENGNQLWLGNYRAATDIKMLRSNKIQHVLTAAAMLDVSYPKDMKIRHKIFYALDTPAYKMTPHFDEAHQFIKEGLQTGNVLVHCAAGISRSSTCVLVYLMKEKQIPFKEAMAHVKKHRSMANPNHGFQSQLIRFDTMLHKKGHYREKNAQTSMKEELAAKFGKEFMDDKVGTPLYEYTHEYQKKVGNLRSKSIAPHTKNTSTTNDKISILQNIKQSDRARSQLTKKPDSKGAKRQILEPANNFLTLKLDVPKKLIGKR